MNSLLTIEETAALLRLPVDSVRRLLKAGRLPGGVKIGGKWRIRADVLDEWSKSLASTSASFDRPEPETVI
jgi:excisionase family DNA binding protein